MTELQTTDCEILAAWRDQPAPLLPILHAFHARDGYLSDEVIHAIAKDLRMPVADLFGTVTFYHFFRRTKACDGFARVCTGPICKQNGAEAVLAELGDKAEAMPCAGRCDAPIPVLMGDQVHAALTAQSLAPATDIVPPVNPGGIEECVFANVREADQATLAGYTSRDGYEGLAKARALSPEDLREIVKQSGLAGRGGAGFPTGVKWQAVAEADPRGGMKYIVANADEGEPGCFKDRALMDLDPHALLEGMAIAACATGAEQGFIYLRYEYPQTFHLLERAIAEATAAGHLGADARGTQKPFNIYVRRGAGAYICGEEGSLLNSLEGKHPFPRNRPPFPVTHGYLDQPTAVNNIETLASAPKILTRGADWYAGLGLGEHKGSKLISLSGDVKRPGNYEVPFGLPLGTLLYDWAGGPVDGRSIQAVTMAGLSGGFLAGTDLDDATLDEPSIRSKGSFLGAGGIMVFDDSRDMVAVAHQAMEFFAHESCGKCFPCRIGTERMSERLGGEAGPADAAAWHKEITDISAAMKATSACGLGMAAPLIPESLIRNFPDDVTRHIEAGQQT